MTSAEKIRARILEVKAALPPPEKDLATASAASALLTKREQGLAAVNSVAPQIDAVIPAHTAYTAGDMQRARDGADAKLSRWRRLVTWWEALESLLTSSVVARNVQPLQDRVIVRRIKPEARSKGGIHLVDEAVSPSMQGYVIAIGAGRVRSSGVFLPTEVQVGDRILFGKFTTEITVDGEEYDVVREDEILAVFEPFAQVDLTPADFGIADLGVATGT